MNPCSQKEIKICFLISTIKKGGGVRSQITLANQLVQKGYNVDVITHSGNNFGSPIPIKAALKEVGLPVKNRYLSFILNNLFTQPHLSKYDVVITTSSIEYFFISPLRFLSRTKLLLFSRHYDPLLLDERKIKSHFLLFTFRTLSKYGYFLPKKILVNSEWTGKKIATELNKDIQYDVVPNGVLTSVFYPTSKKTGLKQEHRKIAIIGKPQKWKGLEDALNGLTTYYKKFDKNFSLNIITSDKIEINGFYAFDINLLHPKDDSELVKLYNDADIFLSTSWYEGFCMPPLEAMACGTPVIITNSGGVLEYAINNHNCLLIPARDEEKLAEAIHLAFSNDSLYLSLLENGLHTAREFTWEKSANQLLSVIKSALTK